MLEETDLSGNFEHDYVYSLGKLLGRQDAPPSSSPVYTEFLTDPLGSIRYVEGPNATYAESGYYPFGGERVISNSSVDEPCGTLTMANHYKFTGLERDTETGLDHTLFRQLSSGYGRWLSADPRAGNLANPSADGPCGPQSLNRYAYVLNNPVTLTDRRGLDPEMDEFTENLLEAYVGEMVDEGGGGGGGIGAGTDPSDPCSYLMANDASCQSPPGLWDNGQPIYGNPGSGGDPSGGGGGGGCGGGASSGLDWASWYGLSKWLRCTICAGGCAAIAATVGMACVDACIAIAAEIPPLAAACGAYCIGSAIPHTVNACINIFWVDCKGVLYYQSPPPLLKVPLATSGLATTVRRVRYPGRNLPGS